MVLYGACTTTNQYPVAEKDQVVDTYFGVEVADPYRWLENDTSQATMEWVKAENKVTADYPSSRMFCREHPRPATRTRNFP